MDRRRLTIKLNSLVHFKGLDGYLSSSGVEGEVLFLRRPEHLETDELLPYFSFENSVFKIVATPSSEAHAAQSSYAEKEGVSNNTSDAFTASPHFSVINTAPEITFGQVFSLIHVQSGLYVSISRSQASENDPDSVKIILVQERDANSVSCEFVLVPKCKMRTEGDKVCRTDHVYLRLASKPVFMHCTEPLYKRNRKEKINAIEPNSEASKDMGLAQEQSLHDGEKQQETASPDKMEGECVADTHDWEFYHEVTGSEDHKDSFLVERYDIGRDQANYQRSIQHISRPYISAGVPVALFHREREAFLSTSITKSKGLDKSGAQNNFGSLKKRVSMKDAVAMVHAAPTEGGSLGHKDQHEHAGGKGRNKGNIDSILIEVGKDEMAPFPLFTEVIEKKEVKGETTAISDFSCNAASLWVIENKDPLIGGAVRTVSTQFRIRHACSDLYLAVAGSGVDALLEDDVSADERLSMSGGAGDGCRNDPNLGAPIGTNEGNVGGNVIDCFDSNEAPPRETKLCLISTPRTRRDLERTTFVFDHMFAVKCDFVIDQESLVIRNELTGMYLCADPSVPGKNAPLALSWEIPFTDAIIAMQVNSTLQQDSLFLHTQCNWLCRYRDEMQALLRKHLSKEASRKPSDKSHRQASKDKKDLTLLSDDDDMCSFSMDRSILAQSFNEELYRSQNRLRDMPKPRTPYDEIMGLVKICQRTLGSLILFCSESDEPDVLVRDGLPIWEHQHMLHDMNVHRLIFDVIVAPFTLLSGKPYRGMFNTGGEEFSSVLYSVMDMTTKDALVHDHKDKASSAARLKTYCNVWGSGPLPKLPLSDGLMKIDDLRDPLNKEIFLVCRLAFRLIRQMVRKDARLADEMHAYALYFMDFDGQRLHVVDALKELYSNNLGVSIEDAKTVIDFFINRVREYRSGGYLDFLSAVSTNIFFGIAPRQEYICRRLLIENADLLCRFVRKGNMIHIETSPNSEPIPENVFFSESYPDQKIVKYVEAQLNLMSHLCFTGSPQICLEEVGKIFTAENLILAINTMVCIPDDQKKRTKAIDIVKGNILYLSVHTFTLARLTDPAIQTRLGTVLYGASGLRNSDTETYSCLPDDKLTIAVKKACFYILNQNTSFDGSNLFRCMLLRRVFYLLNTFIRLRQYTNEELRMLISRCLVLLDSSKDFALNSKDIVEKENLSYLTVYEARMFTIRAKEMICTTLLGALDNAIHRGADELVVHLYNAFTERGNHPFSDRDSKRMEAHIQISKVISTSLFSPESSGDHTEYSEKDGLLAGESHCCNCFGRRTHDKEGSDSTQSTASLSDSDEEDELMPGISGNFMVSPKAVSQYLDTFTKKLTQLFQLNTLIPHLLELTRYRDEALTVESMELSVRLCTIRACVAQKVLQVHTLPSSETISAFDYLHKVALEIGRVTAGGKGAVDKDNATSAVNLALSSLLGSLEDNRALRFDEEGTTQMEERFHALYTAFSQDRSEERELCQRECAGSTGAGAHKASLEASEEGKKRAGKEKKQGGTTVGAGGHSEQVTTRASELWAKTAGATRMFVSDNTVRHRRVAMGLIEAEAVPAKLVIRAEMMRHWGIHNFLISLAPKIPHSSPTFFRLMKFFYLFTLSDSNAKALQPHINFFISSLYKADTTRALCIHIVLAIFGEMTDVNSYITSDFLTECVRIIDQEIVTKYPDSSFIRLLSSNIYQKPSVDSAARRRIVIVMRERGTLSHIIRPRGNLTEAEVSFTASFLDLVCNICGQSQSVRILIQRILPAADLMGIILTRSEKYLASRGEQGSQEIFEKSAENSLTGGNSEVFDSRGLILINPYLRILVAIHCMFGGEGAGRKREWQLQWMGNPCWWKIMKLVAYVLGEVNEYFSGEENDKQMGLKMLNRYRSFIMATVPVTLNIFISNCYREEGLRKFSAIIGAIPDNLGAALARFAHHLTVLENLNLQVGEVVRFRRLLSHWSASIRSLPNREHLVAHMEAGVNKLLDWLARNEHQRSIVASDTSRKVLNGGSPFAAADESQECAYSILFSEETVSKILHRDHKDGKESYLSPSAIKRADDLEAVRLQLVNLTKGDIIIPRLSRNASEAASVVNAIMIRYTSKERGQECIEQILLCLRKCLYTPRTMVGVLNLLYNVLDTALRVPQLVSGRNNEILHMQECSEFHTAQANDPTHTLSYHVQIALNDIGAMNVVTSLCSIEDDVLTFNALRVGVALLEGGNRRVQRALLNYFETHEESFFHNIRNIFERNKQWINHINGRHQHSLLTRGQRNDVSLELGGADIALSEALLFHTRVRKGNEGPPIMGWPSMQGARKLKMLCSLFRFLQLFCEGHYSGLQNYIRSQHDNLHSANIVHEAVSFLSKATLYVTPTNFNMVIRGLELLIEVCQGPCFPNQETLVDFEVCAMICRIIRLINANSSAPNNNRSANKSNGKQHNSPFHLDSEQIGTLRQSLSNLLLALTEGCRTQSLYDKILSQVSLDLIEMDMTNVMTTMLPGLKNDDICEEDPNIQALFNWLIFLYTIKPFATGFVVEQIDSIIKKAGKLVNYLGCVEINRDDGLERVYFRIPKICFSLTEKSKNAANDEVDRSSRTAKLADFIHKSDELIFEIEQTHKFKRSMDCYTRFDVTYHNNNNHNSCISLFSAPVNACKNGWNKFVAPILFSHDIAYYEYLSLTVAIVLNLLLIVSQGRHVKNLSVLMAEHHTTIILCLLQSIFSGIAMYIEIAISFPVQLYSLYKRNQRYITGKAKVDMTMDEVYNGLSLLEIVKAFLENFVIQFRILLFLLALLSLVVSPYFGAFNLLLIVYKTPTLLTFVTAITQNGKQLLLTAFLGLVILYLFTIIGYLSFRSEFDPSDDPVSSTLLPIHSLNPPENCETLLRCFIYVLIKGLRSDAGVGDVMQEVTWTSIDFTSRVFYEMFFFIIVNVIFMNVMFGIIIDTFGQLRDDRREKEQDMNRACFICGLAADTLEKRTLLGYRQHVKNEHNKWMYLYFMHYLRRKDSSDFTGQESFVHLKIQQGSWAFFPEENCLSMIEASEVDRLNQAEEANEDIETNNNNNNNNNNNHNNNNENNNNNNNPAVLEKATATAIRELNAAKEAMTNYLRDMSNDAQKLKSLLQVLEVSSRSAHGTASSCASKSHEHKQSTQRTISHATAAVSHKEENSEANKS